MARHVLIVEDDADVRLLWRSLLEGQGFTVDEAETGLDALSLAHARPDLVLLDGRLPDVSGWDVLSRMKTDDELDRIPVIVITGELGMESRALQAGAIACLTKPVTVAQLLEAVGAALSR